MIELTPRCKLKKTVRVQRLPPCGEHARHMILRVIEERHQGDQAVGVAIGHDVFIVAIFLHLLQPSRVEFFVTSC